MLIPIQCEFYALEGLSQLMNTIKQVKKLYNPALDVEGVLVTMFDGRLNLTLQVMAEAVSYTQLPISAKAERLYSLLFPKDIR